MKISEFTKISIDKQLDLIRNEAIFIELYENKNIKISVYFYDSFFIEVSYLNDLIIDVTPFKRGYKFDLIKAHECEKRNMQYVIY